MKRPLLTRAIPTLASWFIRGLYGTLRVRHVDLERIESLHRARQPYVLAFWHSQLLVMLYARFGKPMVPLISQHRDGDLIARTVGKFGYSAARGSTTRGGIGALKEMIRLGREGSNLAITPDGPRGSGRCDRGRAADWWVDHAGCVHRKKKKLLNSWDRFEVPLPLSRAVYVYGTPIEVPRRLDDEEIERLRLRLENELNSLTERAEKEFDTLWKSGAR